MNGSAREGLILRSADDDGVWGYTDLMPWPELGEPSLEQVIACLSNEVVDLESRPQLVRNALTECRAEAARYVAGRSVLDAPVENHFLLPGLNLSNGLLALAPYDLKRIRSSGFRRIKIKVDLSTDDSSRHALKAFQQIHWHLGSEIKYRLDFNERADFAGVMRFLDAVPLRVLNQIDFIEDPIPFLREDWGRLHRETSLDLAIDRALDRMSQHELSELFESQLSSQKGVTTGNGFQVVIVKPSYNHELLLNFQSRLNYQLRWVCTSNLGHPVGLLGAAQTALKFSTDRLDTFEVHGCFSSLALDQKQDCVRVFHNGMGHKQETPWLIPSSIPGCGFSREWLEALKFEKVSQRQ